MNIKKNYKIYNAKLYTMIKSFSYWYHYFEQLYHSKKIIINYKNLHLFINIYSLLKDK